MMSKNGDKKWCQKIVSEMVSKNGGEKWWQKMVAKNGVKK